MAESAIFTSETLEVLKSQISDIDIIKKLEFLVDRPFDSLETLLNKNELKKYQEIIKEAFAQQEIDDDSDDNVLPAGIEIRFESQTVYELTVRKWNSTQLLLNPDFQRNSVWKPKQKSQFIEAVLLNYPLPPFYFNVVVRDKKVKYVVVDGKQRLTTLHEFVNNKFKLEKLNVLSKLNDKFFSDLIAIDDTLRSKIEDKQLQLYLIPENVPTKIVYDIFNRINTGGTQLERQEIRNCIYLGTATRVLKQLAESQSFKSAIDNGIPPKRIKDQEVVLRYLAFQLLDYKTQYKRMNDFLEMAMKHMNNPKEFSVEKETEIATNFERVMKHTYDFWQDKNFRIPTQHKRGVISIAVMESISYFFSQQNDAFLKRNKTTIQDNFNKLLQNDKYIDAVRLSTGDVQRVKTRIELASEILLSNTIK